MKLSISNLAWRKEEQDKAADILARMNLRGIEIAPAEIWADPSRFGQLSVSSLARYWYKYHIAVVSLQGILFAKPEFNLFGDSQMRRDLYSYCTRMIHLACSLGARIIVFGSPKNKQRGIVPYDEAVSIAGDFFTRLGNVAKEDGVYICLEPTPTVYHTDFLTTTKETLDFLRSVHHPYIRLNLDTSSLALTKEHIHDVIRLAAPYIKHVHISETDFGPIRHGQIPHKEVAKALCDIGYSDWLNIEMIRADAMSNISAIRSAIQYVQTVYSSL